MFEFSRKINNQGYSQSATPVGDRGLKIIFSAMYHNTVLFSCVSENYMIRTERLIFINDIFESEVQTKYTLFLIQKVYFD